MCYNCGCGLLDDDHGDGNNITNQTFQQLAQAQNKDPEEIMLQVLGHLEQQLETDLTKK